MARLIDERSAVVGQRVLQHPGEDGGHAAGEGGPLGGDERAQRLRLQEAVGEQQRAAEHPRHVRDSPRVDVEHRHDHQQALGLVEPERPPHAEAVQPDGAVAVHHALGVAGGAGRVAHRRRRPLVDLRPVVLRGLRRDDLVVPDVLAELARCRPSPTTITCSTVGRCSRIAASSGTSEPSTMTTLSSASLTMWTSCCGVRRRLRVCSTAPMQGIARYASRCSWLFQARVATRSPGFTPIPASTLARRAARSATSRVGGVPCPVALPGDHLAVGEQPRPPGHQRGDRQLVRLHRAVHLPLLGLGARRATWHSRRARPFRAIAGSAADGDCRLARLDRGHRLPARGLRARAHPRRGPRAGRHRRSRRGVHHHRLGRLRRHRPGRRPRRPGHPGHRAHHHPPRGSPGPTPHVAIRSYGRSDEAAAFDIGVD